MDPEIPGLSRYAEALTDLSPAGTKEVCLVRELDAAPPDVLLVLDASFNPPTTAHWSLVQKGCDAVGTEHAALVLASANVDKDAGISDLAVRLAMLDELAATRPQTAVATCGYARFVDKADALGPLFPQARLVFAIGHDTLVRLFDEKYYETMDAELEVLFSKAGFLVANRDTGDLAQTEAYLDDPARRSYREAIQLLPLPSNLASISSSEVRARLGRGASIRGLVPSPTEAFIARYDLYK